MRDIQRERILKRPISLVMHVMELVAFKFPSTIIVFILENAFVFVYVDTSQPHLQGLFELSKCTFIASAFHNFIWTLLA